VRRAAGTAASRSAVHIVPDVGVSLASGESPAGVGGKAGRAHAGGAGERVDLEAGVVGQDQLAEAKRNNNALRVACGEVAPFRLGRES